MLSGLDVLTRACGCFGDYDAPGDHGGAPLSKATKEELYNGAPSYEEPPTWQLKKDDAPLNQRKVPLRARKDSAHAT